MESYFHDFTENVKALSGQLFPQEFLAFFYLYFHGSPYFHVSDALDAVSELLDKQLFSD